MAFPRVANCPVFNENTADCAVWHALPYFWARAKPYRIARRGKRPFPLESAPPSWGDTMKPYREIAALSVLQVICFFLLSHSEADFFMLHFYQTIVYLV